MSDMNTKAIGDITEGMIIAVLMKRYKSVLIPFGENQRYDVVADDGQRFIRVQCKTGRLRDGVIIFKTISSHYHRNSARATHNYVGEIDMFGVYCPETDNSYMVPISVIGDKTHGYLRVNPTKNGQHKGIILAEIYQV